MDKKELSETLAKHLKVYVDDPSKRNVDKNNNCKYSPETTGNTNSPGCFVGSFLSLELANKIDKEYHGEIGVDGIINYLGNDCPKIILDNQNLMSNFQILHDYKNNFTTPKGLSVEGKSRLKYIIRNYNLDIEPFKEFL